MGWHFGYNCKNYLPTLSKCRVLIDLYMTRADLVSGKWLSTQDLLVYLNSSHEELVEQISKGDIKTRLKKDGSAMFQVSSSWAWDDCPLARTGGTCLHFESHDGEKIRCIMDLDDLEARHPNLKDVPLEEDVKLFEGRVADVLGQNRERT